MRVVSRARLQSLPLAALFFAAALLTGCDALPGPNFDDLFGSDADVTDVIEVEDVSHGACWPTYHDDVVSLASNASGQVIYISSAEPQGWPDDLNWSRGDRGVNVLNIETGATRYLARSWDPIETLPAYGTPVPDNQTPREGRGLEETMQEVDISWSGSRFVLGVGLEGYRSKGKLYAGEIPPEGDHLYTPEEGLTRIPINNLDRLEGIRNYRVSPDGSKVAAVVGDVGDLRVYDLTTNQLMIYSRGEGGEPVITNEFPTDPDRMPLVAYKGVFKLYWSPDSSQIAVSRTSTAGNAVLSLFDVSTGELVDVGQFVNSTAPEVAWATDGASMFVIYTPRGTAGNFTDSQFVRLAAEADGEELGAGEMDREWWYRTEPANLMNSGDDETFVFTWENALWRLSAPGGDPSQATFQRVTPDSLNVVYQRPFALDGLDLAVYLASDSAGQHVAVREHLSAEECPVTEPEE